MDAIFSSRVKTGRYKVFVCLDGDSNKRYHIFSEGSKLSLTQLKEDKELKDFLSQLPSPHNLWMKEIGESGNGYLGAAKAEKNEDASLPMNISSIVESAIATTSAAKSADESADESSPKPVELNPNESAAESAAESSTESVKKQKKKPKKKPKKNKVNIPREHFKRVVKAIIKLILNSKKKSTGHPQIVGLVKQLCGFSKNKGYGGDFSELKDEFKSQGFALVCSKADMVNENKYSLEKLTPETESEGVTDSKIVADAETSKTPVADAETSMADAETSKTPVTKTWDEGDDKALVEEIINLWNSNQPAIDVEYCGKNFLGLASLFLERGFFLGKDENGDVIFHEIEESVPETKPETETVSVSVPDPNFNTVSVSVPSCQTMPDSWADDDKDLANKLDEQEEQHAADAGHVNELKELRDKIKGLRDEYNYYVKEIDYLLCNPGIGSSLMAEMMKSQNFKRMMEIEELESQMLRIDLNLSPEEQEKLNGINDFLNSVDNMESIF